MNIAAFDLSLRETGWACHIDGTVTSGTIKPPALLVKAPIERLEYIRKSVARKLWLGDMVVIEDYAYSRSNRAHQMGELGGVIRSFIVQEVGSLVAISPTTLKKFATGKGNASKNLMLVESVRRLGYEGSNHNQADALWLLHAAMSRFGVAGAVVMPKANRQALDKVKWDGLS